MLVARARISASSSSELIHDHEHPIGPQPERFAAKEVDAQRLSMVCQITDNHEGPVPSEEPVVLGEHAAHDVPVDIDAEGACDDARDLCAAEPRIARRELDDGAAPPRPSAPASGRRPAVDPACAYLLSDAVRS